MTLQRVAELRSFINQLDAEIGSYFEESPDLAEAGELLLAMNLAKRDLSAVYDRTASLYSDVMNAESVVMLENGAQIEKKSAYDRKGWQHKDIAKAVVDRLFQMSVDIDTGEVIKSPEDIALELMNYCAPSYWRIKELNNIGINPDLYCETGQLKTSIIVRKGDSE
jgi:hypothetical protein